MFTRRSLLIAMLAVLGLGVDDALAARRRRRQAPRRVRPAARRAAPVEAPTPVKPVAPKPMTGRPLPVPALVSLGPSRPFTLSARMASHSALAGQPSPLMGFGGGFRGPALALRRGETAALRLENASGQRLGLSVPTLPGGPSVTVEPGATGEITLTVDLPAALHTYRAAPINEAASPPLDGWIGPLIILDADAATLPLPTRWGLDDVAVILDDATFNEGGQPVEGEALGATLLANGISDAVLTVPKAFVRLRLINAARARVFRLYFEDETPFHLIATDGGFLSAPVSLDILRLAPGERAEILVDCREGYPARLMTTPDNRERRVPGALIDLEDSSQSLVQVLGIDPQYPADGLQVLPVSLGLPRTVEAGVDAPRRLLSFGQRAAATQGGVLDGVVAPEEWRSRAGVVEVWRLDALEQAETIRVEGARIAVLSEAGAPPQPWNRGAKDTVFVDRSMEIAIVFDRPSEHGRPFRLLRAVGEGMARPEVTRLIEVGG